MGYMRQTPQEIAVDKATNSNNTTENWANILEVCDKAGQSPDEARTFLKLIIRRLNNEDPHVQVQAATLLDACVSNCGKVFHLEVASREFENEFNKFLSKGYPQAVQKLKESLKKWAEGEFKVDASLNLIPSLYKKLQLKGVSFASEQALKKTITLSKDPNVVQSQDEEDQIAKAIELSLKETSRSPKTTSNSTGSSLYPTNLVGMATGVSTGSSVTAGAAAAAPPAKEPRKVRALYDFEAAEDNELTFTSGELIVVLDDSDANWWRGSNHRGEGLFPANFVTSDLTAEPEISGPEINTKSLEDSLAEKLVLNEPENVVINEGKVDRLLHLLHEADPTNPNEDTKEMLTLEREVNIMGPMIDAELERVDRKHAQLTQVSTDLVDAMNLYHSLMREPPLSVKAPYGYPQTPQMPSMMYNGGPMVGPVHPNPPPHLMSSMLGPPMYSLPPDHPMAPQGQYGTLPQQHQMGGMSIPPHLHLPQSPQQQQQQQQQQSQQQQSMSLQSQQPLTDDQRLSQQVAPSGQFSPPQGGPNFGPMPSFPGQHYPQSMPHTHIM